MTLAAPLAVAAAAEAADGCHAAQQRAVPAAELCTRGGEGGADKCTHRCADQQDVPGKGGLVNTSPRRYCEAGWGRMG